MDALILVGLAFLAAFLGTRVWVDRREFYRRNPMGLLAFKDYRSLLMFDATNGAVMLLGRLCAVIGVGCLIGWYVHQQSLPGSVQPPSSAQQSKGDGL